MAKNKNGPENCSLNRPIKRPEIPPINIHHDRRQQSHNGEIPENITHRPPWILDPAMLGNSITDFSYSKRWFWWRVELLLLRDNSLIGHIVCNMCNINSLGSDLVVKSGHRKNKGRQVRFLLFVRDNSGMGRGGAGCSSVWAEVRYLYTRIRNYAYITICRQRFRRAELAKYNKLGFRKLGRFLKYRNAELKW